jgi:K+-sensing histidine kinase KdpD
MAFYRGMYPLIPFILVLIVMGLQLIPALIGNFLFTTVINGGLAVGFIEQAMWTLFFILTILLSLYMISSSSIALYIVTLPEMTPMIALRQARELVRYRRFSVLLRALALILVIFFLLFVIVLPVIFIAPSLAEWIFFLITVLAIPLVHGYMFSLYRELL